MKPSREVSRWREISLDSDGLTKAPRGKGWIEVGHGTFGNDVFPREAGYVQVLLRILDPVASMPGGFGHHGRPDHRPSEPLREGARLIKASRLSRKEQRRTVMDVALSTNDEEHCATKT